MGNRPELYVLVQIVPQIYYYDRPPGRVHLDSSLEGQHKRAAQILVPVKVRIGIAGSAAIGGAALITSQANYNSLSLLTIYSGQRLGRQSNFKDRPRLQLRCRLREIKNLTQVTILRMKSLSHF